MLSERCTINRQISEIHLTQWPSMSARIVLANMWAAVDRGATSPVYVVRPCLTCVYCAPRVPCGRWVARVELTSARAVWSAVMRGRLTCKVKSKSRHANADGAKEEAADRAGFRLLELFELPAARRHMNVAITRPLLASPLIIAYVIAAFCFADRVLTNQCGAVCYELMSAFGAVFIAMMVWLCLPCVRYELEWWRYVRG